MDKLPMRDRVPAVTLVLLTAAIALLTLLYVTAWNSGKFPDALAQAAGLLLAAVLFALGFAQNQLRRAADIAVAEVRAWEAKQEGEYGDATSAMTTFRLVELAGADHSETLSRLESLVTSLKGAKLRSLTRRYRLLTGREWVFMRLNNASTIYALQNAQEAAASSSRARRRAEAIVEQLKKKNDELYKDAVDLGKRGGASQLRVIYGQFKLAAVAAVQVSYLVGTLVGAMIVLLLSGIIVDGWRPVDPPSLELVGAVLIPALALGYAQIIGRDIRRTILQIEERLSHAWPVELYSAELVLEEKPDREVAEVSLSWVRAAIPASLWLLSLQGRHLLCEFLDREEHILERPHRSLSELPHRAQELSKLHRAELLLRQASRRPDNPLTAVALARVLELEVKYDIASDTALEEAKQHLTDAALLLADARFAGAASGESTVGGWLAAQSWYLRPIVTELRGIIDPYMGEESSSTNA